MNLNEKTFIVTGAASGLGAAVAKQFIAEGARVVIADLNEEQGQIHADELGEQARFCRVDVTDSESVEAALDIAVAEGQFRGLVNCAGIVTAGKLVGKEGPHPLESFSKVIQVNLIGTFNVSRLAAARFVRNDPDSGGECGVIINTASIAAYDGQMGQAAYAASKAGVAGMTLPLARDMAREGVRVMTIAPGVFDTAMMAGMPDEVRESLASAIPFPPRLGDPTEFAALVMHIVKNPMLNGEVIRLDGALRMAPK